MQQVYVVHYHEIALKGRNRPMFLKQLQENICRATGFSKKEVEIVSGRLLVHFPPPESSPTQRTRAELGAGQARGEETIAISPPSVGGVRGGGVREALSRVFGISSFSPAMLVKSDYAEIEQALLTSILSSMKVSDAWKTFAIHATRGDKKFAMTSQELNIKLGALVNDKFCKKVDLTNPEITFYVEVFSAKGGSPPKADAPREHASGGPGGALIYTQKIPGPGGLPVGTQPKVAVMLSGGIDSPVAAYRLMKRGAPIVAVHFHSYPFTSRASIDKVKELTGILAKYSGGALPLYLVPLADAQKAVVQNCEEKYRVLLYRRLMVRIAQDLARREGAQALVTGEALGQVASQTVENIGATDAVATMPILRPLIGYDKEEIIAEARRIGTYDVSILPHDDCCTLFMPKSVATRARVGDVDREEGKLNVEDLITHAIRHSERNEVQ